MLYNNVQNQIALILNAKYDHNDNFKETKGFYFRNEQHLKKKGYQILKVTIEKPEELRMLSKIIKDQIGFLWIRGHGASDKITFSKEFDLTSSNVHKLLDWLPAKMHHQGIIYLDSCSTGSLKGYFYQNMQFEFGILTLDQPDIKVVASKDDCYINIFKLKEKGFHAYTIASSREVDKNIALILGKNTKQLIMTIETQESSFEDISQKLIQSLETGETSDIRNKFLKYSGYQQNQEGKPFLLFKDARHDVGKGFMYILMKNHVAIKNAPSFTLATLLAEQTLTEVKLWIKKLHAPINYINTDCVGPESYSPLFAAIAIHYPPLVSFLLNEGADKEVKYKNLFLSGEYSEEDSDEFTNEMQEISPLEYAKNLKKSSEDDEFIDYYSDKITKLLQSRMKLKSKYNK